MSRINTPRPLTIATIVTVAMIMSGHVTVAEDAWPKFRGPDGDGTVRESVELPLRWSATENVTWRTELPGEGWSSPVVGQDSAYLTAAVAHPDQPEAKKLVMLRIDLASGQIAQTVEIFGQDADAPAIHQKNSHASPTLLLTPDRIYAHFGHQGTAALNRQGDVLWRNRQLTFPPVHGNGGSPVLVGDQLIFSCDGAEQAFVAALDAKSGELSWRTDRPVNAARKFSFCTPTAIQVDGQTQVICPGSDCVLALDPSDGAILWQVTYDGYSVVPKPVFADGLVLMATGFGPTAVMAIDPTGRGDVTDTNVVWTMDRSAPKTPSLVAHDGLVYILSDDGILTVVETATGESVYKRRIGGNYSASPILSGDRLYLTSEEGTIRVVRTGRQFELLAENEMGERALASPAAFGNSLLVRTAKALYRIE
jgi:outer membrane protein assembly factor BamB